MQINGINNTQNTFNARVSLKNTGRLFNCEVPGTTKLDAMFNENNTVKKLNGFSIFIKRSIIRKYFSDKDSLLQRLGANICHKFLKLSRVLADKLFYTKNEPKISALNREIQNISVNSPQYIENIAKVGNSIDNKYININETNNPLNLIAKSKDASIFVLNHPNYHKDKFVYFIINSILNKMYVNEGSQNTCPRPKIIVSRNMLKIICPQNGAIYKHMGLTEVDASLDKKNRDRVGNARTMKSLFREFVSDKSNIFIFPEGNNSELQEKPLRERLQEGIAELIKMSAGLKKFVRIVPIGIQYSKDKNSYGKVYIGEPLEISRISKKSFQIKQDNNINVVEGDNTENDILDIISESMENAIKKTNEI